MAVGLLEGLEHVLGEALPRQWGDLVGGVQDAAGGGGEEVEVAVLEVGSDRAGKRARSTRVTEARKVRACSSWKSWLIPPGETMTSLKARLVSCCSTMKSTNVSAPDVARRTGRTREIRPVIDRTSPIDDIVEAHRYVDTGHKRGNFVITVS